MLNFPVFTYSIFHTVQNRTEQPLYQSGVRFVTWFVRGWSEVRGGVWQVWRLTGSPLGAALRFWFGLGVSWFGPSTQQLQGRFGQRLLGLEERTECAQTADEGRQVGKSHAHSRYHHPTPTAQPITHLCPGLQEHQGGIKLQRLPPEGRGRRWVNSNRALIWQEAFGGRQVGDARIWLQDEGCGKGLGGTGGRGRKKPWLIPTRKVYGDGHSRGLRCA